MKRKHNKSGTLDSLLVTHDHFIQMRYDYYGNVWYGMSSDKVPCK